MRGKLMAAVLLLGTLALAALGVAGEMHLLPPALNELAPYVFIAAAVLLLILAWRSWPKLMAWAFKQDDRDPMK